MTSYRFFTKYFKQLMLIFLHLISTLTVERNAQVAEDYISLQFADASIFFADNE